jgi:hypothetical protein
MNLAGAHLRRTADLANALQRHHSRTRTSAAAVATRVLTSVEPAAAYVDCFLQPPNQQWNVQQLQLGVRCVALYFAKVPPRLSWHRVAVESGVQSVVQSVVAMGRCRKFHPARMSLGTCVVFARAPSSFQGGTASFCQSSLGCVYRGVVPILQHAVRASSEWDAWPRSPCTAARWVREIDVTTASLIESMAGHVRIGDVRGWLQASGELWLQEGRCGGLASALVPGGAPCEACLRFEV